MNELQIRRKKMLNIYSRCDNKSLLSSRVKTEQFPHFAEVGSKEVGAYVTAKPHRNTRDVAM